MRPARVFRWATVAQAAVALAACGSGGAGQGATGGRDAAAEAPPAPLPYARPDYQRLSETGLFADIAAGQLTAAPALLAFEPAYQLWSDAADKRRWIALPRGTQIDTTDIDHWIFPIGTKLWKEFSRDGLSLETRLIERYGAGPDDYWMGAFVWSSDRSDALFVVDGAADVGGTTHDAPRQKDCGICHRGEAGRVLGFSALQLSGTAPDAGVRLPDLKAMSLLSRPPPVAAYPIPGDAAAVQALGYLHANCGHCHNQSGTSWHDTQMALRLRIAAPTDSAADTTEVRDSIIGGKLQFWRGGAITLRVAPGQPDASAVVARMQVRGSDVQMPSLATELVDATGVEKLRQWIGALPP